MEQRRRHFLQTRSEHSSWSGPFPDYAFPVSVGVESRSPFTSEEYPS